ncbi:MAG: PAS domain S-box protein, partial [bacterium]
MERVLRETEDRYQQLVDLSPDAVLVNVGGKRVFANPAAAGLFGAGSPQELIGRTALDMVHPDHRELAAQRNNLVLAGGALPIQEIQILRLDGTAVQVEVSGSRIEFDGVPAVQVIYRDISERKQAEAALRETNEYLDNLINYANAPIIVWDPELRITRFNRAFEVLTGRKAEAVIGESLEILFPTAQVTGSMELISETQSGERWETVEISILHLDGSVRTVLWNSATLYAADGVTPTATIAQGQDITERKQAEREIHRRNLDLSVLYAVSRAGTQSLGTESRLGAILDALMEALDVEAGGVFLLEPDGETMILQVHRGLSERFVANAGRIKLGEGISGIAAAQRQPIVMDLTTYPSERLAPFIVEEGFETLASTPLIAGGEVLGAINVGTRRAQALTAADVDLLLAVGEQAGGLLHNALLHERLEVELRERMQAEETVKESEARFRGVVESAQDAIITADADGNIVGWNQAAEHMFGRTKGEVLGQPLTLLMPARYQDSHVAGMARVRSGGDHHVIGRTAVELEGLRKDQNEFPLELSLARLEGAGGSFFTAIIRDITERKQAEEALRQSEEQLRQSQKMEAVGQLAGGIAHDFNNLLTAVLGYSDLLLARKDISDSPAREDVEEIKHAAERAGALTRQILAFSRRQALRPSVVSLNEVLAGMEPLLRRTLGENIELISLQYPDLGHTEMDVHQFEQVLMNLALNARDAMPTGGRLT